VVAAAVAAVTAVAVVVAAVAADTVVKTLSRDNQCKQGPAGRSKSSPPAFFEE
jgi:hypothetical protein